MTVELTISRIGSIQTVEVVKFSEDSMMLIPLACQNETQSVGSHVDWNAIAEDTTNSTQEQVSLCDDSNLDFMRRTWQR